MGCAALGAEPVGKVSELLERSGAVMAPGVGLPLRRELAFKLRDEVRASHSGSSGAKSLGIGRDGPP